MRGVHWLDCGGSRAPNWVLKGDAELLQVSQPTIPKDTKAKIGQLLVIIVAGSVNPLVVHTLVDKAADNFLEFHLLFQGFV